MKGRPGGAGLDGGRVSLWSSSPSPPTTEAEAGWVAGGRAWGGPRSAGLCTGPRAWSGGREVPGGPASSLPPAQTRGLRSERLFALKRPRAALPGRRPCSAVRPPAGSPLGDAVGPPGSLAVPGLPSPWVAARPVASCGPWRSCTQPFPAEVRALTDLGPVHPTPRLRPPGPARARHVTLLKSLDPHSCPASEAPPARPLRGGTAFGRARRPARQRQGQGWLGRSQWHRLHPCQPRPHSHRGGGVAVPLVRAGPGRARARTRIPTGRPAVGGSRLGSGPAPGPPFVVQPLAVRPPEGGVRCRVVPGRLPPLPRPRRPSSAS